MYGETSATISWTSLGGICLRTDCVFFLNIIPKHLHKYDSNGILESSVNYTSNLFSDQYLIVI